MLQPPIFRENREDVMHALMRAHPFATLVTVQDGRSAADHVPLVLHEEGVLRGHLAAANPLVRGAANEVEGLAVFQGPQAYVHPGHYASKREHGKVVPTWNYVVVHARGPMRFERDPAWLLAHLHALTDRHESHRPAPWSVDDAPPDFLVRQLKGLVGFELAIESLEGTWKVSQNKGEVDRASVEAGLRAEGAEDIAALVSERRAN